MTSPLCDGVVVKVVGVGQVVGQRAALQRHRTPGAALAPQKTLAETSGGFG